MTGRRDGPPGVASTPDMGARCPSRMRRERMQRPPELAKRQPAAPPALRPDPITGRWSDLLHPLLKFSLLCHIYFSYTM